MDTITLHNAQKRKFSEEYFENKQAGPSPLKETGEGLLRDIAIGVIGGGLASAILGRYAFVLGLGITGYGHYSQNKMLSALGLGMMASGTFSALTGKHQDDKKSISEQVTERVGAFRSEMKRKLWLDYFERKKQTKQSGDPSVNGLQGKEQGFFTEQAMTDTSQQEEQRAIDPQDFPELNEAEKSYLEQKVDQAIHREMQTFYENRQAIASHLKKNKQTAPKQSTEAMQEEADFQTQLKAPEKKASQPEVKTAVVKPDPYPEYEPEPELIF